MSRHESNDTSGPTKSLPSLWQARIGRALAGSPLNDDQRRSLEQRFVSVSRLVTLLKKFRLSDSDEGRNDLEDINLACRTLLNLNPHIEEEVSTWALLAASKPNDASKRVRALSLDDLLSEVGGWSEWSSNVVDGVQQYRHAAARLQRLMHALLAADDFGDVVVIAALLDCEVARVMCVSTHLLLLS